jgi:hypothetical protein
VAAPPEDLAVLRQAIAAGVQPVRRTIGGLWRLARHPRQSLSDARTSADIFRDLCEGGLVVSTAFPTAEQTARIEALPKSGPAAAAQAAGASALDAILADASERGAAAGDADPIALRTVLQADGDVALLIDRGLADGDQRLLRALLRVHTGAVHAALAPLARAQAAAAALRASVRVAVPTFGLASGATAHWLSGLVDALIWGAVIATATGGLLVSVRWALETYIRRKARKLLAR